MNAERRRSTEAFFGRPRGKAKKPHQAGALAAQLPLYQLDLATPAPLDVATLFGSPVRAVRLEIGFGAGEHLLHAASLHPDRGYIGVEPFVNGLARVTLALARQPAANLRIYDDDATRVLDWLPEASLDCIDLFYPDPWPKPRHWKRRFVNAANLDRFARVLKPGGAFRFASDIAGYVDWTLRHIEEHPAFEVSPSRDWSVPFEDWVQTRYEAQALREGRVPAYLIFNRI